MLKTILLYFKVGSQQKYEFIIFLVLFILIKGSNFEVFSESDDFSKINILARNIIVGACKENIDDIYRILSTSENRIYFINCLKMLNKAEISMNSLKILEDIFNLLINDVKTIINYTLLKYSNNRENLIKNIIIC